MSRLFEPDTDPEAILDALAGVKHSPGSRAHKRLVARHRRLLAEGVHPATGYRLRPELGTCGDCAHMRVTGDRGRCYFKCVIRGVSSAEATDIRKSWPACGLFDRGANP